MQTNLNNFKLLFIHGYTASSLADFYPPLTKDLDKLGVEYYIPDLPGGRSPHAAEWLTTLHKCIHNNTKPLVIVGHSLGTRAALLYIEKYKPEVAYLFLVAAFANRLENAQRRNGEAYPDFFTHKVNTELIAQQVKKTYVLHSTDDHSIPYEQGVEIASDLHANLITFTDRDHFSEPKNSPVIFETLLNTVR